MKDKAKRIKAIGSLILFLFVFALSGVIIAMRFVGNTPNLFGYTIYYIISPSMEPMYQVGDVIIGKSIDPATLEVDDVIVYHGREGDVNGKIVTHQIVAIEDGVFTTQGLANTIADPPVTSDMIISKVVGKAAVLGWIFTVINSQIGFLLLVVLPLVILLVNELYGIFHHKKHENEDSPHAKEE